MSGDFITVTMPDGEKLDFPDSMSDEQIEAAIQHMSAESSAVAPQQQSALDSALQFARGDSDSFHAFADWIREHRVPIMATSAGIAAAPFTAGMSLLPALAVTGGASALGGMAGAGLNADERNVTFESDPQARTQELLSAGAEQGAADVVGDLLTRGAYKVARPALAPLAKRAGPEAKRVLQFAKERLLPADPSGVMDSSVVKTVTRAIETLGGLSRNVAERKAQAAQNFLSVDQGTLSSALSEFTEVEGRRATGETAEAVARGVRRALGVDEQGAKVAEGAVREATEAAYERFFAAFPEDTIIRGDHIRATAASIRAREASQAIPDKALLDVLDSIDEQLAKGMHPKVLHKTQTRLGKIKSADGQSIGELRAAFKAEFDALAPAGEALEKLQAANVVWAAGKDFSGHPAIRKIARDGVVSTRALFPANMSATHKSMLGTLKKNLSPEEWDELLSFNLENLLSNAADSRTRALNGVALWNRVGPSGTLREMLETYYPKQTVEALENLALYAKAHSSFLREMADSSGASLISGASTVGQVLGAGGAVLAGEPITALTVMGATVSAPALANSMLKPNGLVNRWLTTGLMPPEGARLIMRELTKGGTRFGADAMDAGEMMLPPGRIPRGVAPSEIFGQQQ